MRYDLNARAADFKPVGSDMAFSEFSAREFSAPEFSAPDFATGDSGNPVAPMWLRMARPRPAAPSDRRGLCGPPAPSRRAGRAHMGRDAFIWLVVAWSLAVLAILAAALAIRLFA